MKNKPGIFVEVAMADSDQAGFKPEKHMEGYCDRITFGLEKTYKPDGRRVRFRHLF